MGVADYYPNRQVSVLMYGGSFVEQQPEAARRVMVAYLRGSGRTRTPSRKNVDRAAVVDVLVDRLPVKDRGLYDRMLADGTLLYMNPDGYAAVESIAWDQDWLVQQGMAHTKLDLGRVIDNQFVDYALAPPRPLRCPLSRTQLQAAEEAGGCNGVGSISVAVQTTPGRRVALNW